MVFEGESFRDLVNGLAFGAFPDCVTRCFTLSAAQAHEGDDLRHALSPFSLFLSSFLAVQRILGYVRPRRIVAVHPPETGEEGASGGFRPGQTSRSVVM